MTTVDLGGGLTLISAGSNSVLAVGRDGAILADTTFAGPALAAKVGELTTLPVRYVVNTHSHPDHTGGNDVFARQGAVVVATENAARRNFRDARSVAVDGQRAELKALPPSQATTGRPISPGFWPKTGRRRRRVQTIAISSSVRCTRH